MARSVPSPARRAFADLVRQADSRINLARAALLIAQEEYPSLDIDHYLARLDELARQVQQRLALAGGRPGGPLPAEAGPAPTAIIAALNTVLFDEWGFHGNQAEYYDPRNSFLNDVIERRTGIPITISLVYMEVAARVGLPLLGVGLPGHFIVQYPGPAAHGEYGRGRPHAGELFIDPYNRGTLLTRAECAARFRQLYGADFTFSEEYLTPLTRHQLLARMLNNLKAIYMQRRDYARAVVVVERLLLVQPDALWELKDRGMLYYRLGAFAPAVADLRRFLKQDPDAEDAPLLQYYVRLCQKLLLMMN
jgi:regulator of sirC expression with transglutaminase-like and TPR domain